MAQFYVHRNLNRSCWSVLLRGKLHSHRQRLALGDVEFRIRPSGHRRALREGKRNVHAFVVGRLARKKPQGKPLRIRYDLGKGQFVTMRGRQVRAAAFVQFDERGRVWAWGSK